jgi:hypothetical protein
MHNWNTRTTLMAHQQAAVAKLLPSRVNALFMDMGTGKTRVAIELIRLRQSKLSRVLWCCPVALKETIRYEILKHTNCQPEDIYTFDDRTTERTVTGAFWVIVGLESISGSTRVACTFASLVASDVCVIVDESSYIKGHRSKRAQRLTVLSTPARYRMILTGTPLSQGAVDLYSQMRFLSPKILGYLSFYSFARNHLEYSERHKGMIVRDHNTGYLAARIKPYVYQVTKDECLDLPDKLFDTRYLWLSEEQRETYDLAKSIYLDEMLVIDDWQSSLPIFRLFTALQSIVCGFWTPPESVTRLLPHHRISRLMAILRDLPPDEPVVIWAKYRHAVTQIVESITAAHGADRLAQFHGGLAERDRNEQLEQWRRRGGYLVATQSAGGHGLDLTRARYAVFYANSFKYSERLQAEDRNHRIGQAHRVTYIDLHAHKCIDDRISRSLAKKENTLDSFRREVNKIKASHKEKLIELVKSL